MPLLTLLEGPGGSGKSADARAMLETGEAQILADLTLIWAAIRGLLRDPETGRYPVRDDDDPAVRTAVYLRAATVRNGLENGRNVVVTSGTPATAPYWQGIVADVADASMRVRTVDPGEAEVTRRLLRFDNPGDDPETSRRRRAQGRLSRQCQRTVDRWYRPGGTR